MSVRPGVTTCRIVRYPRDTRAAAALKLGNSAARRNAIKQSAILGNAPRGGQLSIIGGSARAEPSAAAQPQVVAGRVRVGVAYLQKPAAAARSWFLTVRAEHREAQLIQLRSNLAHDLRRLGPHRVRPFLRWQEDRRRPGGERRQRYR